MCLWDGLWPVAQGNEMSHARSTHDALDDPRNADIGIYVDGAIVHRDAAVVSVYDSGFLLGDGVWEGLRLYHRRLAFLDAPISA